jgi:Domain of unknown function (DUF6468)
MSDIGLIMNGLLGALLVGALFLGWRLEGRLKALRASHQSFKEAVEDLDRAAGRAEQGLADLRAATDEAAETLAGRIDRAGHLAGRLERLTAEATLAEAKLIAAPKSAMGTAPLLSERPRPATRDSAFSRFAERYGAKAQQQQLQPLSALAEAAARNDLILEDEEEALPAPPPAAARISPDAAARIARLQALARPRSGSVATPVPPPPSRAADDDLFEAPPRRAAGGLR